MAVIHWFRNDLRIEDNPALFAACENSDVIPVFIYDNYNSGEFMPGLASQVWLHESLEKLNIKLGNKLQIYQGDPKEIFLEIFEDFKVDAIYWNRCYEPWQIKRDTEIKAILNSKNIECFSYNGSLLWEPWQIKKSDGTPFKVFTPFYKKGCLLAPAPRYPLQIAKINSIFSDLKPMDVRLLNLKPSESWVDKILKNSNIGEDAANEKLDTFLKLGIKDYKDGRNFPSQPFTSKLSPHLHFGEISPNQIWYAVHEFGDIDKNKEHFCSELGWREFSYNLLFYNKDLPNINLQRKFDNFKWRDSEQDLRKWQLGMTGIPMVDAGMRELWQTGNMHNRLRMIVGSFLVKNIRLDWRHGERWFWDTLFDADLANNSAGWQWIAGCGADAAPYFRIFNPITQGERFDPDGKYIRKYIPEISNLPNKYIFSPWLAPESLLQDIGIKLGRDYPLPLVDLKASREQALLAFKELKS